MEENNYHSEKEQSNRPKKTKSGKKKADILLGTLAVVAIGIIKLLGGGSDQS